MTQPAPSVFDPKTLKEDPAFAVLTDEDLADRWGVTVNTLRYRRSMGKPFPKYFKIGRYVRYYLSDVLAFEQANMRGGGENAGR